ncbi:MAG: VWA domain-containing protein [Thermomonas hydrothermalis]|uniref:vWA domain-containing protein n=1 Tax=Thermomonas hydrothermalis TaxID=213588 RepID=UPI0023527F78|nr:VWA domain-containing protein [Thermomonas hydrothermalis]MCL6618195.1 VWA domain-containing protein [Thermomonas hydrothermalis]
MTVGDLWPALDGLVFAWPWLLLAVPLPWWVARLWPVQHMSGPALRVPWAGTLQRIAGQPDTVHGVPWLAGLAWVLLCLAAARPQQPGPPLAPPQSGRDLMVALDLSASMGEEDMALGGRSVDRLTAARAVLADFLARRSGDRVGLIVFGDRAYVLTPLTADLASVRQQLATTTLGLAGRATALGDAIALAVKRLQSVPARDRVLILLTDGVNTAGVLEPEKAAAIARDAGVRIHAIAFGGQGDRLTVFGFQLPLGGGDEVDEAGLARIAALTGGRFFRARNTDELAAIYAELDRLEPVAHAGRVVRPMQERYPWPLAAALGLGLLSIWRGRRA